jgi:hypothetical protein
MLSIANKPVKLIIIMVNVVDMRECRGTPLGGYSQNF